MGYLIKQQLFKNVFKTFKDKDGWILVFSFTFLNNENPFPKSLINEKQENVKWYGSVCYQGNTGPIEKT